MKIVFQGVSAEELYFKMNPISGELPPKIAMQPRFSRQLRKSHTNKKAHFVAIGVKIESTEKEPKPYDLSVTILGAFEVEPQNDGELKSFMKEATQIIYPYLRAAVAQLTASAYVLPLHLPAVAGSIFQEDNQLFSFPGDIN